MNYAIQSDTLHSRYLESTSRKRTLKHRLLHVTQGLVLLKLGKQEYAIEPGQTIWIPFDWLCALSYFPNTESITVDFSVRLKELFPAQAGYVRHSQLSLALIHRMADCSREEAVYTHLTQVLKDEVQKFEPELWISPLSSTISQWQPEDHGRVTQEQHIVLLAREARKHKLSGLKMQAIAQKLAKGNEQQLSQICKLVTGEAL